MAWYFGLTRDQSARGPKRSGVSGVGVGGELYSSVVQTAFRALQNVLRPAFSPLKATRRAASSIPYIIVLFYRTQNIGTLRLALEWRLHGEAPGGPSGTQERVERGRPTPPPPHS